MKYTSLTTGLFNNLPIIGKFLINDNITGKKSL